MKIHEIRMPRGANRKTKRRGRGPGSGHGKTSCRGHKGAKARSGPHTHMGFEGGQMSIIRRMPKRGFTNIDSVCYQVVNIEQLKIFDKDAVVTKDVLRDKGLVRKIDRPIKILGTGDMKKPITIKADACSESAKKKIEQAGGKVEIVSGCSKSI